MAPGALPRPGRVPEQRLLSPEIRRWWRRSCGTLSGKLPTPLGFPVPRLYIGEGASLEEGPGSLTRAQRRSCVWGPGGSYSSSDLWKLPGKIRLQELVSSNSENISCVSLLKHKNSRKQGTSTVATR
jgi:hypothetical protein